MPNQLFSRYKEDELSIMLMKAVAGEAEDQGIEGMTAVAEALLNRGYFDGVYGLNSPRLPLIKPEIWDKVSLAVKIAKSGHSDIVKGASFWQSEKDLIGSKWDTNPKMELTAKIKGHYFFKPRKVV